MSKRILVLVACAATLVSPIVLSGTVLVPAEFREVVTGSDIIAYGRVVETTAVSSDDRSRVETFVTLRVGTYLKGAAGETLVFSVPGGQVGRYRHVLVGAPRFAAGEEAVVFLKMREDGQPVVFGLNQGVFRVRLDRTTKRRMVVPPPLLARGDTPQAVVRGAPDRRPVAIETFGAQVQAVMAEPAAQGLR
jgi:hypothetical protein